MHDENGNIEMGEWHFPKLNFENDGLREYLLENMCYYIREYDIDGYRCDVGPGVPLDFWEEGRRRMNALKRTLFFLTRELPLTISSPLLTSTTRPAGA